MKRLVLALVAACGGTQTLAEGGTDATTIADSPSDVSSAPICPAAPPSPGDACVKPLLQCEWGPSFWAQCDTVFTCTQGGKWDRTFDANCGLETQGCPAYASIARGASCTPSGLDCAYPEAQCDCRGTCGGPFNPDAGIDWKCSDPPPGCPWPRPRLGTACTQEKQACDYTLCCSGALMECTGGIWQATIVLAGCP